ncbi:MAG: PadR family transcriptional regulator [Candidatus Izimaplasma sp.]|nr:PadR family transcriptional regulator [Candidatus Izimaplasma bacterium]
MAQRNNTLFGDLLRGHTDTILLSILLRGDSYGYRINKTLEDESDRRFFLNEATLYTTFKRMQKDGYIESYWKSETSAPPRKYYSITEKGKKHLKNNIKEWEDAAQIIKHFIENG